MGFLRRHGAASIALATVLVLVGAGAQANTNDPLILGHANTANTSTSLTMSSGGFFVYTTDPSPAQPAIVGGGQGGGDGVDGNSTLLNGVQGLSSSASASGVYGQNDAGGYGLAGRENHNGVAVLADSADGTGTALRTTGRLQFLNRSGLATVASGKKSVVVTLAGVTATSMVIATAQQTGGFFVQAAVPAGGAFTIYLNKAPTSPATVKVAYLVLS